MSPSTAELVQTIDVAPAARSAVDNQFILGLLWQERTDVGIALLCALLCTVSNLAAPVISGYFIECLAGRQPMDLYPKVRHPPSHIPSLVAGWRAWQSVRQACTLDSRRAGCATHLSQCLWARCT